MMPSLSFWWVVPFVGLLLSIAIIPIVSASFWHHRHGLVSFVWALVFLLPYCFAFGLSHAVHDIAHVFFLEYMPFVILLAALYVISGGIHIGGRLQPSPSLNTGILAFGTLIASWTGTTGAAMLLIRPILDINRDRRYQAHVVIFFIFLVANIGGALTPLGDPPLFLGFLNGVDFFWTTDTLFPPMLLLSFALLGIFWLVDRTYFAQEGTVQKRQAKTSKSLIDISGGFNGLLLIGVVLAVLASGSFNYGTVHFLVDIPVMGLVRDGILLLLLFASLRLTPVSIRQRNQFDWFPMKEVAQLFAGIFVTIIPAIAILKELSPMIHDMEFSVPMAAVVFWSTGLLSSVLDNAPTYLVFFNAFGGDAQILMNEDALLLMAISAGAVFMGALTYIGNAPNFMVRSIAVQRKVAMPSFFGYMAIACAVLFPLFAIVTVIWFL